MAVAGSGFNTTFSSTDGGLTWFPAASTDCPKDKQSSWPHTLFDWRNFSLGQDKYRIIRGESIERSIDNGVTWLLEFDLSTLNHPARRLYYEEHVSRKLPGKGSHIRLPPTPLYALVEPISGNLVLAMSQDGVLVRTEKGEWIWATVGPYRLESINRVELLAVLRGEFLLAVAFVVLTFVTILRGIQGGGKASVGIIVLIWFWLLYVVWSTALGSQPVPRVYIGGSLFNLPWVLLVLWGCFLAIILTPLPPEIRKFLKGISIALLVFLGISIPFGLTFGSHLFVLFLLCLVVVTGFTSVIYRREPSVMWRILVILVSQFVLFMLPFVLWTQGLFPRHDGALLLATILAVIVAGATVPYLIRYRNLQIRRTRGASSL